MSIPLSKILIKLELHELSSLLSESSKHDAGHGKHTFLCIVRRINEFNHVYSEGIFVLFVLCMAFYISYFSLKLPFDSESVFLCWIYARACVRSCVGACVRAGVWWVRAYISRMFFQGTYA